jgi:hypothetical protein
MANLVGMMVCGTSEPLRSWHHSFVTSPEGFHHPTAGIANGIGYEPPILSYLPELKDMIRRYALANLSSLSRENVHNYLHTVALPKIHKKSNQKLPLV